VATRRFQNCDSTYVDLSKKRLPLTLHIVSVSD